MTQVISDLHSYGDDFPDEKCISDRILEWIQMYWEFAFVKENLKWHITASMLITNPSRTRVLLMFHKRFQTWSQFGGHCDGEIDIKNVALREFHEESWILEDPDIIGDIFSLQIWDVAERTSSTGMYQPRHQHKASTLWYLVSWYYSWRCSIFSSGRWSGWYTMVWYRMNRKIYWRKTNAPYD